MAPYPMRAYAAHRAEAEAAEAVFEGYCGRPMRRVPGMCTVIRLAVRLDRGADRQQAAAREYLYRWRLILGTPTTSIADALWGAPHTLGM